MTALKRKQESGTTVLYVSHDVGSVKSLCSRGIHLEHGQVKNIGIAADVAAGYIRMMREEMNENQRMVREKLNDDQQSLNSVFQSVSKIQENSEATSQPLQPWALKTSEEFDHRVSQFRYGTGEARITFVELLNTNDEPTNMVEFNQKVKIRIFFEAHEQKTLSVNFAVMDDKKNNITGSNLRLVDQPYLIVRSGDRFQVDYSIQLPLTEGIYSIQTSLTEPIIADQTANFIDVIDDAVVFTVSRWMKARLWHRVFLFPSVEIKTKSQEHNPAQHL